MHIVQTTRGPIRGTKEAGIHIFRGVPYARPPVGDLRYRHPQSMDPWISTLECERFRNAAQQPHASVRIFSAVAGAGSVGQGEDCLYLNLWTPGLDAKRRPVLVWIHGGGFVLGGGSAPIYDGTLFARRGDVVVVTINYRLGALGSLDATELGGGDDEGGNLQLRDQLAALRWVRDNIESFGGDPENITVFGESAGGMSIGALLGAPAARGLIRRAILQSGATNNVSSKPLAEEIAGLFLDQFFARPRSMDELRALPAGEILRAQRAVSEEVTMKRAVLPWQPILDGDFLPKQPIEAVAAGACSDLDLIIGTTRDEFNIFMLVDPEGRRLDAGGFDERLQQFEEMASVQEDLLAVEAVRRARAKRESSRSHPLSKQWSHFQSERMFHLPAAKLADHHAGAKGRCFVYRFDHTHPLIGRWLGACHGYEVPFVFGTLRRPSLAALFGATPAAFALSRKMMRAWINFAHSGDPSHEGLPDWSSHGIDQPTTMRFARRCEVVDESLAPPH